MRVALGIVNILPRVQKIHNNSVGELRVLSCVTTTSLCYIPLIAAVVTADLPFVVRKSAVLYKRPTPAFFSSDHLYYSLYHTAEICWYSVKSNIANVLVC